MQNEFDEAIIRLHIPFSFFGDPHGLKAKERVREVQSIITKSGIKVEATHEFKDDIEIVKWLNENDVNCYLYDYLDGCGIASSPDYALAACKPIAVTKSHQMRHMWNLQPSVLVEQNSLKTIIENGILPLKPLLDRYTHENIVKAYESMCDQLLCIDLAK